MREQLIPRIEMQKANVAVWRGFEKIKFIKQRRQRRKKKVYTHLNAGVQRVTERWKSFFSDQKQ